MIEEDSAAMKQKKMEFEFEKATFGKQTEFAKNVLKKQDEEIKVSIIYCINNVVTCIEIRINPFHFVLRC